MSRDGTGPITSGDRGLGSWNGTGPITSSDRGLGSRSGTGPITSGDRRLGSRGNRRLITFSDRRLGSRGNRWTCTGIGRRSRLTGTLGHNLDLIDVQKIAIARRVGSEAQMRVTAGDGQRDGDFAGLVVVEMTFLLLPAFTFCGHFPFGTAALPISEDLPAALGTRGALGTVLEEEVFGVLEGSDIIPELDLVHFVVGKADFPLSRRGLEAEDDARVHFVVVSQTDGARGRSIGIGRVGIEMSVGGVRVRVALSEILPGAIVKVVDENGSPVLKLTVMVAWVILRGCRSGIDRRNADDESGKEPSGRQDVPAGCWGTDDDAGHS